MNTYTTVQGDCWDLVAFKLYGSEQKRICRFWITSQSRQEP